MTSSPPRLAFRTLLEHYPLRIEAAAGSSRRLVISMTSVGTSRHEWPPREFVKIASQAGENHVICVTDISRSWMNGPGLMRRITDVIGDYVLRHGITELVGLGVSMGAYNLLVLGQDMPFARIIALSPQFSVHPEIVPDEKRWTFFRRHIMAWPHPDLSELPAPPCEILMVHGDAKDEQRHWRLMPAPENLTHLILPDTDHNFPRQWRAHGDLDRILRPALTGQMTLSAETLTALGATPRAVYDT